MDTLNCISLERFGSSTKSRAYLPYEKAEREQAASPGLMWPISSRANARTQIFVLSPLKLLCVNRKGFLKLNYYKIIIS